MNLPFRYKKVGEVNQGKEKIQLDTNFQLFSPKFFTN